MDLEFVISIRTGEEKKRVTLRTILILERGIASEVDGLLLRSGITSVLSVVRIRLVKSRLGFAY